MRTTFAPITSRQKTKEIIAQLKNLAQEEGPDFKLPTVRDLCREFQVSSATLDDALWNLEQQGVIRRRQGSGIFVSSNVNRKTVALAFGKNTFESESSPFCSILLRECEKRVQSHNENFSFFLDIPGLGTQQGGVPVHRDLADAIAAGRLQGIILAGRGSPEQEEWMRKQGIPVVGLQSNNSEGETVTIDYSALIRMGVDALADQGCRRIALISPFENLPEEVSSWNEDVPVFLDAVKKRGLPSRPEWIQKRGIHFPELKPGEEFARAAMEKLFALPEAERPDGIVIPDDMVTRGVLASAARLGLSLGRDVKIATHANKGSEVLEKEAKRLTLLEINPAEIARAMLDMLETLMDGKTCREQFVLVGPRLRLPHDSLPTSKTHP